MAWNESDPQMKSTYSGPEQGVGSTTEWESAGQMGKGKATVIESIANKEVKTKPPRRP
jgi:hypothetical protein